MAADSAQAAAGAGEQATGRPHLYLVDGSGFIFRAFHALPPMTRKDGTPVNAVYGFCNMLMRLLDDMQADHIAVVFDAERGNFRNEIYPDYKAHRPPPPEELVPQFALIRDATRAFNLPCLELQGYEADDIIATLAEQASAAGIDATIVSSDKDLMQLVTERISMLDPIKLQTIGPAEVETKFGVAPACVVDVQALAGDPVDNVPGVPGIGVKTAAQLINTYGDLDTLLARAEEIKQPKRRQTLIDFADQARVSRQLVRLDRAVPITETIADLGLNKPDLDTLLDFLHAQGFRSILQRVESRYGKGAAGSIAAGPAAAAPAPAADTPAPVAEYELVTTVEALEAWIARAFAAGTVAFDTETTNLQAQRAELVGVSLAVEPGQACYIPVAHRDPQGEELAFEQAQAIEQIDRDTAIRLLKPLLEDPGTLKVAQNAKYDMAVMRRYGVRVAPIDDTMLLSYVLDGTQHGHGMDELAQLFLGLGTIKFQDVAGKGRNQVTFDLVPLDKARDYAAEDADVTLRLHRVLRRRLVPERMTTIYERIERPLIGVLADMENAGVQVDCAKLRELSGDFARRLEVLEAEVHRLAGHAFNVGSPKQLGEVLFGEMGLQGGKKGKTGAYATGADVLEDLAAQGHELPARVLDWRQLSKLKSTYTDALDGAIHPDTGRVHTCFSMTVTSTGRLSSTDPNLQNIPIRTEEGRKIREAFIAAPGYRLLSADYSQIELRLLAHVAEMEGLRQAFREGQDIHALTASQVFGMPLEGMEPGVRRRAKTINFGIIYGISPFGLARQLQIPQGEARAYIDAYFQQYPGIRDYMEKAKDFGRRHGFVTTLFGRKCWVPGIRERNPARRSFSERVAINAPLQGSAADIIKRAMVRMPAALAAAGSRARMLLQVHDELVFEVPEDDAELTAGIVREVMQNAATLSVPLVVETGIGDSWAAAH